MTFSGRSRSVAGGSTVIGLATALRLAEGGARVAICSHDPASLEPARTQIQRSRRGDRGPGRRRSAGDMAGLVEKAVGAFGGVDYLVNSAGIQTYGTVVDAPEKTWDRTLAVNLKGAYLAARHAIPRMIERGGGAVVNVSSVQGLACQTNVAAYAASKGALNALTRRHGARSRPRWHPGQRGLPGLGRHADAPPIGRAVPGRRHPRGDARGLGPRPTRSGGLPAPPRSPR